MYCYKYEKKMLQEKKVKEVDISVSMHCGLADVFFRALVVLTLTTCGQVLIVHMKKSAEPTVC